LAKSRGLMINAEYSPVIGWENRTFVWSQFKSPGYKFFQPITGLYSALR
jgi:hypothetical protein